MNALEGAYKLVMARDDIPHGLRMGVTQICDKELWERPGTYPLEIADTNNNNIVLAGENGCRRHVGE